MKQLQKLQINKKFFVIFESIYALDQGTFINKLLNRTNCIGVRLSAKHFIQFNKFSQFI